MCEGVENSIMCSRKGKSLLRESTPEVLQSFTWDAVLSELNTHVPTIIQVLRGIVQVKRRVQSSTLQKARSYRPSEKSCFRGLCCNYSEKSKCTHELAAKYCIFDSV